MTPAGAPRLVLSWPGLLAATILIIVFIPIRRYTMPGALPFELEPYRVMIAFVTVGWLMSLLVDGRVRLRKSYLERPIYLIVCASLMSIIANSSRVKALAVEDIVVKKLTFFVSFIIVFYLILSVVRTHGTIDRLLKVLVGGGAIVGVCALVESRTHYNVFNNLSPVLPFLEPLDIPDLDMRGARLRVFASSQHPIALGAFFAMLLPLSGYLGLRTGQRRWWIAAVLLALGAFSTVTRTSMLMIFAVGLVFLWLRPAHVKRMLPAVLPMLVVVHFALPGTLGTLEGAFFPEGGLIAEQAGRPGERGSGRIADLGPSLEEFADQPLFGQGFGTRVVD
jgi:polysaccharide biosynthesis protein PslJ